MASGFIEDAVRCGAAAASKIAAVGRSSTRTVARGSRAAHRREGPISWRRRRRTRLAAFPPFQRGARGRRPLVATPARAGNPWPDSVALPSPQDPRKADPGRTSARKSAGGAARARFSGHPRYLEPQNATRPPKRRAGAGRGCSRFWSGPLGLSRFSRPGAQDTPGERKRPGEAGKGTGVGLNFSLKKEWFQR